MLTAGLDLGTTHCKMLLCDAAGNLLWEQKRKLHIHQPHPGWQEQDPLEIRAQVQSLLEEFAGILPGNGGSCRIVLSTAMHSLFPVDSEMRPLYPMLTWADLRSQPQVLSLATRSDRTLLYQQTGVPLHPMSPLCKIEWFREVQPDLFQKTFKWVSIKDWIWWQLTGRLEVDHSVASASGMFDIRRRQWLPEALSLIGIDTGQLAIPVPVTHRVTDTAVESPGGIRSLAAEWCIGGSDGFTATLGSGAVKRGDLALTIGTSAAVRVLLNEPVELRQQGLFQYAADPHRWLLGGAMNNGGNLISWFSEVFLQGSETPDATLQYWLQQAADVPPGCLGLKCVPWVYGERAPIWDASATASFTGIRSIHGRAHFLRAILEGVAENMARVVELIKAQDIPVERVYASGGFLSSPLWVSIVENAIGLPLLVSQAGDASALGAIELGRQS